MNGRSIEEILRPFPPASLIRITDLYRFWSKINKTDSCWLWTGAKGGNMNCGYYGAFRLFGKVWYAHRVAWYFEYRKCPGIMQVLHECSTPLCVYPRHLRLGDSSDNHTQRIREGKQGFGEDAPNAYLTESMVRMILKSNEPGVLLAKKYGVSPATISAIRVGRIWKHLHREGGKDG